MNPFHLMQLAGSWMLDGLWLIVAYAAAWLLVRTAPVFLPLGATDSQPLLWLKGVLERRLSRAILITALGAMIWLVGLLV